MCLDRVHRRLLAQLSGTIVQSSIFCRCRRGKKKDKEQRTKNCSQSRHVQVCDGKRIYRRESLEIWHNMIMTICEVNVDYLNIVTVSPLSYTFQLALGDCPLSLAVYPLTPEDKCGRTSCIRPA